jgi:hypothetical protein
MMSKEMNSFTHETTIEATEATDHLVVGKEYKISGGKHKKIKTCVLKKINKMYSECSYKGDKGETIKIKNCFLHPIPAEKIIEMPTADNLEVMANSVDIDELYEKKMKEIVMKKMKEAQEEMDANPDIPNNVKMGIEVHNQKICPDCEKPDFGLAEPPTGHCDTSSDEELEGIEAEFDCLRKENLKLKTQLNDIMKYVADETNEEVNKIKLFIIKTCLS